MSTDHGVVYTPENVKTTPTTLQEVLAAGISYVNIYWVDLANTRRNRILPIEYFSQLVQSSRPGVNIATVGMGLVYLMMPEGFTGVGEYLYAIDMDTLRVLYGVGPQPVGAVLGRFEHKNITKMGKEVKWCPRTSLVHALEQAQELSAEFLVGFESEFVLLKSTNPVVASNVHQWSGTNGLLNGSAEATILQEIADSMRLSKIPLQMYHSEACPGQYEIVSGPLTPLMAADALIFTREIIVHVAAKHGLHATFVPRPFMYSAGSSTHAHVSVHSSAETGQKVADKLSPYEEGFLAGLLNHLPAVSAFTIPTPPSYKRVADGVWSGGTYISFGNENREAPIRLTNHSSPSSRNFELRFIDATANPYFALAAILRAGLAGITSAMKPETADCNIKNAAEMSESEREEMGVQRRMPLSVDDARAYLKADKVLIDAMGEELVEKYLAVNKTLAEALTQDDTDEAKLTRWVEFY